MAHHTLLLKAGKFHWPWQRHHWGQGAGDPGEVQDAHRVGFQPPRGGVIQIRAFASACERGVGYLERCGQLGSKSSSSLLQRGEENQK